MSLFMTMLHRSKNFLRIVTAFAVLITLTAYAYVFKSAEIQNFFEHSKNQEITNLSVYDQPFKTYYNERNNWSMQVPVDWEGHSLGEPVEKANQLTLQDASGCLLKKKSCLYMDIEYFSTKHDSYKFAIESQGRYREKYGPPEVTSYELSGHKVHSYRFQILKAPDETVSFYHFVLYIILLTDNSYLQIYVWEDYEDTNFKNTNRTFLNADLIRRILASAKVGGKPEDQTSDLLKFTSPQGKYYGEIEKIGLGFSYKFKLSIYNSVSKELIFTKTALADFKESKELLAQFIWSPEEDILIAHDTEWGVYGSIPRRDIIALNKELGWSSATWYTDSPIWLDHLTFVGDLGGECLMSVELFDGRKGSYRQLKENENTIGWQIDRQVEDGLLIQRARNNCWSSGDGFEPGCVLLNKSYELVDDTRCKPDPRESYL